MKQIRLKAMAKVNLGLDVVGKREDGYHEVRMIMQTVNLYDKIFISVSEKPGIRLKTNLNFLPVNENNLIYKAAKLLMDEFEIKEGVDIQLQKFIPVAAGMAGGCTDAATTLIGMNHLFDLGLSRRQLMERSVKLGADVPYCVTGGTALSEGIGEILTRLPDVPRGYVLVAKPGINVSTKFVYTNLKLDQLEKHPDIDAQIEAIRRQDFVQMARLMGNVLETVTIPEYPVVQEIKDFMMDCGAVNAMMSGSGPTVFGLYTNQIQAEKACERLRDAGLAKMVFLTTFVGQNPYA